MGNVAEYEGMAKELKGITERADNIDIFSTDINKCIVLTVSARPLCYDVTIGDDLVYSCNLLENAITIYDAIRADLKGEKAYGN